MNENKGKSDEELRVGNNTFGEAYTQVQSLTSSIQSLKEQIKTYRDTIKNMPVLNIQAKLEMIDSENSVIEAKERLAQALGLTLSDEDHNTLIANAKAKVEINEMNVELAEDALADAKRNLKEAIRENPEALTVDDLNIDANIANPIVKINPKVLDVNESKGMNVADA